MKHFISKNRKWFGYSGYVVVIAVLLLYLRFPTAEVASYLERKMDGISPDLALTVEQISVQYPPGFMLSGPRVFMKKKPAVALFDGERLLVSGNLWKILRGERRVSLDCDAYGGVIRGDIRAEDTGSLFGVDLELQDIKLDKHDFLAELMPAGILLKAGLSGTAAYEGTLGAMNDGTGEAALKTGSGQIEVVQPFFGFQGEVDFHEVKVEATLENRKLQILANLIGQDIDGEMSGTIHLEQPFSRSRLTFQGRLSPSDDFLNKVSAGFLDSKIMKKGLQGGGISFAIQGTVEQPKLKFF